MRRSEATPKLLAALEEPGMLYLFEEDYEELLFVFSYIRKKGWSRKELTDAQKKELAEHLAIAMKEKFGESWVEGN